MRKSSRSMMELPGPRGCTPAQRLRPRTQGMDSTRMAARFTAAAFFRLQPHLSMAKERMFSKTAMTVERAAKAIKTKKRKPHSRPPPGMALKTLGRVTKIRDGPWSGVTPKAKQAGKMMSPAIKATKVSSSETRMASPVRPCSLPM